MSQSILEKLNAQPYLTDSGLETTLVFHDGLELPYFAAFTLLDSEKGRQRLREYFSQHIELAAEKGAGFILETPTWRANPDWAQRMNMPTAQLERLNRAAVTELQHIRDQYCHVPTLISGCVGPRGDGYNPEFRMTAQQAQEYHRTQIGWLAAAGADMVTAMTLCYCEEAIGITKAANASGVPVVISFTTETDGKLIDGTSLQQAIDEVDQATDQGPVYYMINCAHPNHFQSALIGEQWLNRVRGVRANASIKSHAELDDCTELDDGNPLDLGEQYKQLKHILPNLTVYGGCCGTDHRHIEAISHACL